MMLNFKIYHKMRNLTNLKNLKNLKNPKFLTIIWKNYNNQKVFKLKSKLNQYKVLNLRILMMSLGRINLKKWVNYKTFKFKTKQIV